MDYIKLLQAQVNKWQGEQKCGFCWEFDAPLLDSGVNKHQTRDNCCVYVFATNISTREIRNYDSVSGLLRERYDEVSLTIEILRKADIGDNVYRELDYPLSQSKWSKLISPIKECLSSDDPFDFCQLAKRNFPITSRSWAVITNNKDDNNYVGWRINMTLRDNDPALNYVANSMLVKLNSLEGTPVSFEATFTGSQSAAAYPVSIVDGFGWFDNTNGDTSFATDIPNTAVDPVMQNSFNEVTIVQTI
jgi:hypothetical protein